MGIRQRWQKERWQRRACVTAVVPSVLFFLLQRPCSGCSPDAGQRGARQLSALAKSRRAHLGYYCRRHKTKKNTLMRTSEKIHVGAIFQKKHHCRCTFCWTVHFLKKKWIPARAGRILTQAAASIVLSYSLL